MVNKPEKTEGTHAGAEAAPLGIGALLSEDKIERVLSPRPQDTPVTPSRVALQEEVFFLTDGKISDRTRIENNDLEQNTTLRREHAESVRAVVHWYLGIVGALLWLQADGIFKLSDAVLITILTTTTVTVLGLYATVMFSLFPPKN